MKQMPTIPGFQFAGIHCGIKDHRSKKDLGIIHATEAKTTIAGVFTRNKICAAPVRLCQKNLKRGRARLVVINSGIANAATGKQGMNDARATARFAAKEFRLKEDDVFVSSTGRIGERVPVAKIKKGVVTAKKKMRADGFFDCAQAICTTDASIKVAYADGKLGGKKHTIAVMAKGAGMIEPNMATMLCYVVTDLQIAKAILQSLLKEAVDATLNCLTVDGDTSTNDTVLMLASGLAGNKPMKKGSAAYRKVQKTLTQLLEYICLLIASDGEGATKCFRVHVSGAKTERDAGLIAKAIANSPLVKTALFGNDPNWGRILCAAGYAGARIAEGKTTITIGNHRVFSKGRPQNRNERPASNYLRRNKLVEITIELGLGQARARAYGCDLTYDYVKLNAEYRT